MIVEKTYQCRVCGLHYSTEKEARSCQSKHQPKQQEYAYCEICGAGWQVGYLNPTWAVDNAKTCEKAHHDKGEVEDISLLTFWLSQGQRGKYYGP